jgi:hypothetical protein
LFVFLSKNFKRVFEALNVEIATFSAPLRNWGPGNFLRFPMVSEFKVCGKLLQSYFGLNTTTSKKKKNLFNLIQRIFESYCAAIFVLKIIRVSHEYKSVWINIAGFDLYFQSA